MADGAAGKRLIVSPRAKGVVMSDRNVAVQNDHRHWGDEVIRRTNGVPFLVYKDRPRSVSVLLDEANRWRGRTYLVQGDERITFDEFLVLVDRGCARLRETGVRPGDRVLLLAWNSNQWVVGFWSLIRAGAIVILGNGWWSDEEVEHALTTCTPALVVTDDSHRKKVSDQYECVLLTELGDDVVAFEEQSTHDALDEDSPAMILFTAGTTGSPKGVVLSHLSLIALQQSLLHITKKLPWQLSDDYVAEVVLVTGPLFHIGGIQSLVRSVITGETLVFPRRKFDPDEVLRLIEQERVTRWGGVPTMLSRVLADPTLQTRDLTSLVSLTLGGASVQPRLVEAARVAFPNASTGVSQIYGLSEAGGSLTSASGRDAVVHSGSVGRPLPLVELRIDDPNVDGVGEIVARTPTQMSGYWGFDEGPITDDGWLHTGDLGRLESNGYLYLTGRSKDVIIRGGENVACAHVEAVLSSHPDIIDAAVLGLPDEDLGEIVGAVVRIREGVALLGDDVRRFASERLASFEVPTLVVLTTEPLPVNTADKVDKRQLHHLDLWSERFSQ